MRSRRQKKGRAGRKGNVSQLLYGVRNYNIWSWRAVFSASTSARGASGSRSAMRRARSRVRSRPSSCRARPMPSIASRSLSTRLRAKTTDSRRSLSACRLRWTARRRRSRRASPHSSLPSRSERRCRSRWRTSGSPAWKPRAASRFRSATGKSVKTSSTPPRRPSSCRTTSTAGDSGRSASVQRAAMKKLSTFILVVSLLAGGAVAWMSVRIDAPYRGYHESEQFVDLPAGSGSVAIGHRLVAGGVVRDLPTFRAALWMSGQGRHLKAGEYRFDRAMTPFEVIDKIARGDVYVINVTFPEGLTIAEMSKIFASHGVGTAASFLEAAKDPALVHDLDPAAKDLEGYLFPETYGLSRHADAPKLIKLMVSRFEHVFTPELRQAAAARNLTVRQAVTLASIVEKETARAEERPLVAAVYTTRLRIGMALQCDPTVIYALTRRGGYAGNIHKEDL